MNLGENIYKYRTQKNMSQGDLADQLEVSRQSVSKWENNSAVPELEKLMKMAQLFGITLDELVSGEEPESSAPAAALTLVQEGPRGLSARKVVGIVLLSLGVLLGLVCLIMAIVMHERYKAALTLVALFIGIPLSVIGLVCLLVKKHPALVFAWVMYTPVFLFTQVGMLGDLFSYHNNIFVPMNIGGLNSIAIFTLAAAGFGAILYAITIVQMCREKIQASPFARKLLSALMVLSLVPTLVLFLIAQLGLA